MKSISVASQRYSGGLPGTHFDLTVASSGHMVPVYSSSTFGDSTGFLHPVSKSSTEQCSVVCIRDLSIAQTVAIACVSAVALSGLVAPEGNRSPALTSIWAPAHISSNTSLGVANEESSIYVGDSVFAAMDASSADVEERLAASLEASASDWEYVED